MFSAPQDECYRVVIRVKIITCSSKSGSSCVMNFVKGARSRSLQRETKTGRQMLNSWRRKQMRSKCKTKVWLQKWNSWRKKRTRCWIKTANGWKIRERRKPRKRKINQLFKNTPKSHFVSQLGHLALVVPNSSNWMGVTFKLCNKAPTF